MPFGVDATGLTIKTIEEVLEEIETEELAEVDPALDLSPDQPIGQINGIFSKKIAELYELAQTVYGGFDPNSAEGVQLDNLCAITGLVRIPAKKSTVSVSLDLGASFFAAAGTMIANVSGQETNRWVNVSDVSSVAPGTYTALFQSEEFGPIAAPAGTLTVITAPISGWNSITNAADAILGRDEESDTAFRLRREQSLGSSGSCTVDGIRAELLKLEGVNEAFVFENETDVYDGVLGLAPHSFEAVIDDSPSPIPNTTIAQTVWNNKPSGIETQGAISATATDSAGGAQIVKFSRATAKDVWLTYILTTDANYPVDGDDQVKSAAVALGQEILRMGSDVIAIQFRSVALTVPGVVDVPTLTLGFAAAPIGVSNLAVSSKERAVIDTSRILVSS